MALTLHDAIDRGLKTNLGLLVSDSANESARGQRLRALSALLPQVNGQIGETVEQLNLKTIGFDFTFPGVSIPTIVGPFHYTDVRAYATWSAFDYSAHRNYRSAQQNQRAAQLSAKDARDLVVQATASAYLQIIADASRREAIRSQVETSRALYDRASDQQKAGTSAGIDVLRSQVELKQQQQRLLAQTNQFDKDKLALARVIGLPPGQQFNLSETAPFSPLTALTQDQALSTALAQRSDYQSYQARVRAAEESVKAARAERYPTAGVTADYGDVGSTLANSHGTFTFVASAKVNLFDGRRISGDVVEAQAALKQRRDELADLAGQIDYQVRTAFLDIRTAADQVAVAQDNLGLADETLTQARDRFAAGVTDNIEVVQAQESVASANDSLISALYSHGVAKIALARFPGRSRAGNQKIDGGEVGMAELLKDKSAPRRKPRIACLLVALVVVVVLASAGYYMWRYLDTYESTDDAQIDGHINAVSGRITGNVIEVRAEDEQLVKAGDVLVRIDPRDYEVALAKAEADLHDAQAALESSRIDIPIIHTNTSSQLKTANSSRADAAAFVLGSQRQLSATRARLESAQAQVRETEANVKKASDDVARYKLLVDKNEIPRQQYDNAVDEAAAAQASLDSRRAAVREAEQNIVVAQSAEEQANQRITQADASIDSAMTAPKQVAVSEARAKSALAQVAQKKALVDQARLNLSYCTIVAAVSGIVGKKTVELGQNISPGQQLMAVVPLDDIWVTANFKETQLNRMNPGQRVRFKVDASGREYSGKVQAVGGASGSRFSLLPPENATGNYVKVVQRIPVRINLDPGQNEDHRLRPGMSVNPKVFLQ